MEGSCARRLRKGIREIPADLRKRIFCDLEVATKPGTILYAPQASGITSTTSVRTSADWQTACIEDSKQVDCTTVFFIAQEFSWGRLQISEIAFCALLQYLGVFDEFVNVVRSRGLKIREGERVWYGFRSYHSTSIDPDYASRHELCYNVPYVEKHRRQLSDPWSIRQTGAYWKFAPTTKKSRWVIIDLIDRKKTIEEAFAQALNCCPARMGVELLQACGSNWAEYIEHLESQLQKLNDKAIYTKIDTSTKQELEVTHIDLQGLQKLHVKILRASHAVEAASQIFSAFCAHCAVDTDSNDPPLACEQCSEVLRCEALDLTYHTACLVRLSHRLKGVSRLLSSILTLRNEALLQASNSASNVTLTTLLEISQQSRDQHALLAKLFGAVQADSVLLKALSIMATVYLPASLIASVFSSNLVQTQETPANDRTGPSGLVLSPQFWIYIAVSLPLMCLTLLWVAYLNHRSRQKVALLTKGDDHRD